MCYKKLLKVQEAGESDSNDENEDKLMLLLKEFCEKLEALSKVCICKFSPDRKRQEQQERMERNVGKQSGADLCIYKLHQSPSI